MGTMKRMRTMSGMSISSDSLFEMYYALHRCSHFCRIKFRQSIIISFLCAYISVPLKVLVHKPKRDNASYDREHSGRDPSNLKHAIC